MKCILKNSALLKEISPMQLASIKKELTFPNPKYTSDIKQGRLYTEEPQFLEFFMQRGSNSIIIPRGSMNLALRICGGSIDDITDFTVCPPLENKIKFTGDLRDYQEDMVGDIEDRRYGLGEAATGAGKTIMGVAMTARRQTRTLVIVHSKELLDQWKAAYSQFSNVKRTGTLGDSKFDLQDVTIGIINSVRNRLEEIQDHFGFVIYDECHRSIAPSWIVTINSMRPKFHIGLSATPFRNDGMTKALYRLLGPMLHKVDRKHLENIGAVLVPTVMRVQTNFLYNFNNDYSQMMSRLTEDKSRNALIANEMVKEFLLFNEPIMVVSDRVAHCEDLYLKVQGRGGIKAVMAHSKMGKTERKKAVDGIRSGRYNTLIATASLLSEGFDAPDLNALFLTTPMRFAGRVIQVVGRVLRPSKGGKPRVYDFRDTGIPVLRNSGFARDRTFRQLGW